MITTKREPFNDVVKRYEIMLIDTCFLMGSLGGNCLNSFDNSKREITFEDNNNFRKCLEDSINKHTPIFLTKGVYHEYNRKIYEAYRRIDNCFVETPNKPATYSNRVRFFRNRKKGLVQRGYLLNLFKERDHILKLEIDQRKLYAKYHQKYFHLMKNGIGEVDFDLLISSLVLTKTVGSTAIFSNDFPICRGKDQLMRDSEILKGDLSFFIRRKESELQEIPFYN